MINNSSLYWYIGTDQPTDETDPVITCPSDYTLTCQTTCTRSFPRATATDDPNPVSSITITYTIGAPSDPQTITEIATTDPMANFALGDTTVTAVATDSSGNQSPSCSFTVSVEEGEVSEGPWSTEGGKLL